jgi:hypothetical protein
MNRVRTGLTGLGFVFVLMLGASAMLRPSAPPLAGRESGKEAAEPLAQLGVAPGADKPHRDPHARAIEQRGTDPAAPPVVEPLPMQQPVGGARAPATGGPDRPALV